MKLSLKNLAGKYIEECFEKAQTLAKIWGKLNRFWDFFNYELFRHVLRVMFTDADDPLLSQLAEYESEMDKFLYSTKLSDFFKVWPFSIDSPQEKEVGKLKNVIVRVNKSWDDCTLRDVKNISNTFAQGFFLPREFLLVAGVGKSSVSILWSVPPSLASSIEQGKEDFLADNDFLSITIDGIQVYPLTPIKQASLRLKRMYTSRQISKNLLQPYKLARITTVSFDTSPSEYVRHTLRGDKDDIHCNKFATTLSTLGHDYYNNSPARLVLVEGAPGVGKTTFSLEACIKWANKELLKDTAILFLLPLRDFNVQNINNLDELLSLINLEDKSLVEELEANKGEDTSFWLDGWDEIASTLDDQSCFFKKLVSGEILPKARVIVTSRPWATDYIKTCQPSQNIEIVASVQDQIDWLIELKKSYPQKSSTLLEQFLKYLDETPAVKGHMHTPLATSITLLVYQWCQESSSTLPATVTQLYTSYTCFCIHGYLDNHSHFGPKLWKSNNLSDLIEPLKTFFHSLSGISLNGLLDNVPRLVFPDLPDHLRLETLGLMQTVDPLYTSAVVSYHFNHLTLQEYLAAFSLSQMSDEERGAIVARCIHDGHFTGVLRFLSVLTKSSPILRDHMRRMLDSGEGKSMLTVFHWLFEGGSIAEILGEGEISIRSTYSWSALDYFVTGYCIARSNCDTNFEISGTRENTSHLFQAFCSADGEQGNASITSIKVLCSDLGSQSLRYMQDIPTHFLRHLKKFIVCYNQLSGTAVDHIAKTILHVPQLEEFDLRKNNIQRGGAASLISALCDQTALKKLNLAENYNQFIAKEDCEQLAKLLCSSQYLESLNVSANSLSSDSVHILFRGLQQNCSLKKLVMSNNSVPLEAMTTLSAYLGDNDKCKLETGYICGCDISPESAIELAHGLSRNCSVKELHLSYNPLGDSGVTALGRALETNKTITKLYLDNCYSMTTIGGAALASSLRANSTIEVLDISHNSLGGEAIQKFAELIQHNKTLKRLDIRYHSSNRVNDYVHKDDSLTQSDINALLNSLTNNQTLEHLTLPKKFRVKDTDNRVEWD